MLLRNWHIMPALTIYKLFILSDNFMNICKLLFFNGLLRYTLAILTWLMIKLKRHNIVKNFLNYNWLNLVLLLDWNIGGMLSVNGKNCHKT